MDVTSINKIYLNSKKFFFLSLFGLVMVLLSFFHIEKELLDYFILIFLLSLTFSGLYFTSCSFEIDLKHPFITYHRLFGLIESLTFNLNNLQEFQYKESSNGTCTNFVLVFPDKKLQITMFNTNFLKAMTYLRQKYPDLPIKEVKF